MNINMENSPLCIVVGMDGHSKRVRKRRKA